MVTQTDVDQGTAPLLASLQKSAMAAFQGQITSQETLVTPLSCTSHITVTPAIGKEASRVSLLVEELCTGSSYNTAAMQEVLATALNQEAREKLGGRYARHLSQQTALDSVSVKTSQGGMTLTVKGGCVFSYQFDQQEMTHFKALIAGKSRQQAMALLLTEPGVSSVSLNTGDVVPGDVGRIQIVIMRPF